jgi:hypothetical protein
LSQAIASRWSPGSTVVFEGVYTGAPWISTDRYLTFHNTIPHM